MEVITQPVKPEGVHTLFQGEELADDTKGLITWAGLARLAWQVSVCRDLGTFVKRHKHDKNQLRDYMSWDPGIAVPGSRLTGLRFFHVIAFAGPARLISPWSHQNQARFGLPWFIASAINWAGSPHVIPGRKSSRHTEAARLTGSTRLM